MIGLRMVGCCVHVATLISYLGKYKYTPFKLPGVPSELILAEENQPSNNPNIVRNKRLSRRREPSSSSEDDSIDSPDSDDDESSESDYTARSNSETGSSSDSTSDDDNGPSDSPDYIAQEEATAIQDSHVRSGDNPDFIAQEIHECYVTVPEINEAPQMHNDDEPTIPNSSYSRSDTQ